MSDVEDYRLTVARTLEPVKRVQTARGSVPLVSDPHDFIVISGTVERELASGELNWQGFQQIGNPAARSQGLIGEVAGKPVFSDQYLLLDQKFVADDVAWYKLPDALETTTVHPEPVNA